MAADSRIDWEYYRYDPTLVGAIIFTILFAISSAIHSYQIFSTRTWYFMPFLIGCIMESLGYVGRILSHFSPYTLGPYIMQTLLLLVAPALLAASIYMILARLITRLEARHLSPVSPRFLTPIFVTGDVLSFVLQSAGGGIMAGGTLEKMELGESIVLGGLGVQILFFACFLVATAIFHMRINREEKSGAMAFNHLEWRGLIKMIYVSGVLILVRSIFRMIEYGQGNAGYLMSNEVWLYIFDSLLIIVVAAGFNWWHPSKVITGRTKENSPEVELERLGTGSVETQYTMK